MTTVREAITAIQEIEYLIELPDVYDGWSAKRMKDGTLLNRWDKEQYPRRWAMTQEWIDADGGDS